MYSNYRSDPYAAAAAASGQTGPLRHDLAVAYQQQQQQTGYPPPSQPRQSQAYGNASGAPASSYAPPLPQYYGTQQRA